MAGQGWFKATFFEISQLGNGQLNVKRKVNCGELHAKKSSLGLPHIVKATPETCPNPRVKVKPHLHARSFQHEPCWEMGTMPNVHLALSSARID